jgi:hypothetical protein
MVRISAGTGQPIRAMAVPAFGNMVGQSPKGKLVVCTRLRVSGWCETTLKGEGRGARRRGLVGFMLPVWASPTRNASESRADPGGHGYSQKFNGDQDFLYTLECQTCLGTQGMRESTNRVGSSTLLIGG